MSIGELPQKNFFVCLYTVCLYTTIPPDSFRTFFLISLFIYALITSIPLCPHCVCLYTTIPPFTNHSFSHENGRKSIWLSSIPLYPYCVCLYTSILLSKDHCLQRFAVKKIVANPEFSVNIAACSPSSGCSGPWNSRHTTEQRARLKCSRARVATIEERKNAVEKKGSKNAKSRLW